MTDCHDAQLGWTQKQPYHAVAKKSKKPTAACGTLGTCSMGFLQTL